MHVGVADAAVRDADRHFVRLEFTGVILEGKQMCARRMDGQAVDVIHKCPWSFGRSSSIPSASLIP